MISGVQIQDSVIANPTVAGVLEYPCFRSPEFSNSLTSYLAAKLGAVAKLYLLWLCKPPHQKWRSSANSNENKTFCKVTLPLLHYIFLSRHLPGTTILWEEPESVLTAFKAPYCVTVNKINWLIYLSIHLLIAQSHFYFNHLKLQLHLCCQKLLQSLAWESLAVTSCLVDAHNNAVLLGQTPRVWRDKVVQFSGPNCKHSIFMHSQPVRESSRKGSTEASEHSFPSQAYAFSCPPSPACSSPPLPSPFPASHSSRLPLHSILLISCCPAEAPVQSEPSPHVHLLLLFQHWLLWSTPNFFFIIFVFKLISL